MGLHVVATPIGNYKDISENALQILREAEWVIGEEKKETTRLLKALELTPKKIDLLNEHSDEKDLEALLELCKNHKVALVSDCGTPGFCDPGADLVRLCRHQQIPVRSVPGPSSLMSFLSICGHRMDEFLFRGFLPLKDPKRKEAFSELKKQKRAVVIMDTPYRLKRVLEELNSVVPNRKLILGIELSKENEQIITGSAKKVLDRLNVDKAEFVLAVLP